MVTDHLYLWNPSFYSDLCSQDASLSDWFVGKYACTIEPQAPQHSLERNLSSLLAHPAATPGSAISTSANACVAPLCVLT